MGNSAFNKVKWQGASKDSLRMYLTLKFSKSTFVMNRWSPLFLLGRYRAFLI